MSPASGGGGPRRTWLVVRLGLAGVVALLTCWSIAVGSFDGGLQATSQPAPAKGPAYLLIALPSNTVVAESRPDVLAAQIAPGSLIKIATLIAAVERQLVDRDTTMMCRRTITIDGHRLTCVHPDLHRPMNAVEAVGYSCNVFFGSIAQRLPRAALDDVLIRMGLRATAPDAPTALAALGIAGVRATPRELLTAFLKVAGPTPAMRMPDSARAMLTAGLRMAAAAGTASAMGAAGIRALAKTGTAPMAGGGYNGIVVATTPDSNPTHAIVVAVAGGSGADAAAVAVNVMGQAGLGRTAQRAETGGAIRVGVVGRRGGTTVEVMALESYVARVVAGEMAAGASAAALEALAITVRTFAMKNRGRHASEGFDLCDLTHCQVMGKVLPQADRAAQATAEMVMYDAQRLADVYYSASCGGHTESPARVWPGAADVPYLPARPDPACAGEPAWSSEIAEPNLRKALQAAGLRGAAVRGFSVATRDLSGRAAELRVEGMVPERLSAAAFQLSAGRTLGWQVVKSTRFDIRRTAIGFVLSGSGLGHGVGLCVRGATARAAAGRGRDEILAAYFPGLAVRRMGAVAVRGGAPPRIEARPTIRITLPESERDRLDTARAIADSALRAMATSLGLALPPEIALRFHPTVEAYGRATGQPWWTAARTVDARIDLLPFGVLRERGILDATVRHEVVHVLTNGVLQNRPLWVREGLAVVKAGELHSDDVRPSPSASAPGINSSLGGCPSDGDFRNAGSADESKRIYRAAGRCVETALARGLRWQDLR